MLQGHTFHSFLHKDLREGDLYVLSQFLGGLPAPIFLFLTGVTMALMLDGKERRGIDAMGRFAAALRRAGYLLLLAFAVRLQAYLFSVPWSKMGDLLRVDILNCMGVSLAVLSVSAFFSTQERVKWGLLCGVAFACLAPLVSAVSWEGQPELLRAYLAPSHEVFGLFPWAAFVAFGIAFGSMIRLTPKASLNRFLQWTALVAFGIIATAGYFSFIPYSIYRNVNFWVDSPGLVFIKVGVILLLVTFGYLWLTYLPSRRPSFLTLLGTSSLLVYWLHLEIVYGRWFWFWKLKLSIAETMVFSLLLVAGMCLAAWAWRRKDALQPALRRLGTRLGIASRAPEAES
ncbi:MAG: hypothetical protein MUF01_02030 [Bryobacterales bacterium]|jgi:uncharacterized membrane protein|nr:hypothetical protein [Bryobacterales bacterium]